MSESADKLRCTFGCWAMGGIAGTLAVVLLVMLGAFSWPGAIFSGGLIGVIVALVLTLVLCTSLPTPAEAKARLDAIHGRTTAAASAAAHGSNGAAPVGSAGAESAAKAAADQAAKAAAADQAAKAAAADQAAKAAAADQAAKAAAAEQAAKAAAADQAAKAAAAESAAMAAAAAPAAPADVPDGGSKPVLLTAPRAGGPDNLKEIKGVGPKMEGMLHAMGVFHFDQVASWTPAEVAWVDDNLQGFKGRVLRDNWVEQAKILAAGGETEFSKKVEQGGVY
jgi:predicted flap endonuclease-1-like 5' DNA nuclease